MLSNLYLYRYASLFQALYAWHGVPINIWFTTFYKSIKVPSLTLYLSLSFSSRYRFPWSWYDTHTHTHTYTYTHVRASLSNFVRLYTRSYKFWMLWRIRQVSFFPSSHHRPPSCKRIRTIFGSATCGQIGRRDKIIRTRPINGPEIRPLKLKSAARRCPPMNYSLRCILRDETRSRDHLRVIPYFVILYTVLCGRRREKEKRAIPLRFNIDHLFRVILAPWFSSRYNVKMGRENQVRIVCISFCFLLYRVVEIFSIRQTEIELISNI